ncbi:hypothetical protein HYV57_04645 [Candidatus Peregrinibacteria bacterium]|nr:hypothetical protein [Candidatus Peregrinibacteria bacterium]
MIHQDILHQLRITIPNRERSNFVNHALDEALTDFSRQKASEMMDTFRKEVGLKLSEKKIRKAREYGRK